jgi:quercetin 2,3-dioxygenase
MGNIEVLKRGDIQMTSAGTGISHSEKAHGRQPVHFLQIWSLPHTPRLRPAYFTRHFSDAEKQDKWATVVAPYTDDNSKREAQGPAPVHSALTLYATLLSPGKKLDVNFKGDRGYIHVIQTSGYNPGKASGATVTAAGETLREGDGGYLKIGNEDKKLDVENTGDKVAEVLVFDLD